MKCPFCGFLRTKVVDSREVRSGEEIRRRRLCEPTEGGGCESRFTTFERVERRLPVIVKKDGGRMPYDREKVRNGILIAASKRGIQVDEIEQFLNKLEKTLSEEFSKEAETRFIGQEVMRYLKTRDHVAYARFASVYMDFQDIEEFKKLLTSLSDDAA